MRLLRRRRFLRGPPRDHVFAGPADRSVVEHLARAGLRTARVRRAAPGRTGGTPARSPALCRATAALPPERHAAQRRPWSLPTTPTAAEEIIPPRAWSRSTEAPEPRCLLTCEGGCARSASLGGLWGTGAWEDESKAGGAASPGSALQVTGGAHAWARGRQSAHHDHTRRGNVHDRRGLDHQDDTPAPACPARPRPAPVPASCRARCRSGRGMSGARRRSPRARRNGIRKQRGGRGARLRPRARAAWHSAPGSRWSLPLRALPLRRGRTARSGGATAPMRWGRDRGSLPSSGSLQRSGRPRQRRCPNARSAGESPAQSAVPARDIEENEDREERLRRHPRRHRGARADAPSPSVRRPRRRRELLACRRGAIRGRFGRSRWFRFRRRLGFGRGRRGRRRWRRRARCCAWRWCGRRGRGRRGRRRGGCRFRGCRRVQRDGGDEREGRGHVLAGPFDPSPSLVSAPLHEDDFPLESSSPGADPHPHRHRSAERHADLRAPCAQLRFETRFVGAPRRSVVVDPHWARGLGARAPRHHDGQPPPAHERGDRRPVRRRVLHASRQPSAVRHARARDPAPRGGSRSTNS